MSVFREHIQKGVIDVVRKKRSPKWRKVRKAHVTKFNCCAACGRTNGLEVHHIKDFSTDPSLELAPHNLITLCDKGTKCHLSFGHLGDWKSINPDAVEDSKWFREKVENRR